MQQFSVSPKALVSSFWDHRDLMTVLAQRDVIGRYRGSSLGLMWSFFNPLFMLAVYTFVFSVVLQAKWGQGDQSKGEFALLLFSGLIVFNFFSECLTRSPGMILGNASYVKKVVFPLEILPLVLVGSALFHAGVSVVVWLLFYMVLYGAPPHLTVFLLPIVMLPVILMASGVTWFFTALGVYVRDVAQFVGIISTTLMFLSPVFYPIEAVPENFRPFLLLNPLTPALDHIRDVLMWGRLPNLQVWALYLAACAVVAWLGFAWFQKTRKGFSDVL